jgi:hypothetical protein
MSAFRSYFCIASRVMLLIGAICFSWWSLLRLGESLGVTGVSAIHSANDSYRQEGDKGNVHAHTHLLLSQSRIIPDTAALEGARDMRIA